MNLCTETEKIVLHKEPIVCFAAMAGDELAVDALRKIERLAEESNSPLYKEVIVRTLVIPYDEVPKPWHVLILGPIFHKETSHLRWQGSSLCLDAHNIHAGGVPSFARRNPFIVLVKRRNGRLRNTFAYAIAKVYCRYFAKGCEHAPWCHFNPSRQRRKVLRWLNLRNQALAIYPNATKIESIGDGITPSEEYIHVGQGLKFRPIPVTQAYHSQRREPVGWYQFE